MAEEKKKEEEIITDVIDLEFSSYEEWEKQDEKRSKTPNNL